MEAQNKTVNNPLAAVQDYLKHDPFLLKAARGVAQPRYWYELEGNGEIIWGKYKSSRSQCQTVVDLRYEKIGFQCDCRSRKNPCKHGMAILLLLMDHQEQFKVVLEVPEEIKEWINKRDQRLQPKERTAEEEAQLAAQRQQNREKRLQQMRKGLDELETWIRDAIRTGTSKLYSQPEAYWASWSSHLVNAKLGDLGKRLARFSMLFQQEDWNEILLQELAELYFLTRAFRKMKDLPVGLQQDLFTTAGLYVKKKELAAATGVKDNWLVVAQQEEQIDRLRAQKTWLFGQQTQQYALLLEYAFSTNPFPSHWQCQSVVEGELIFFPSNYPQRAFFRQFQVATTTFDWNGFYTLGDFQAVYTAAIARNPWLVSFPVLLEQVIPYTDESTATLWLVDSTFHKIPCAVSTAPTIWKILSVSGGHPIAVFGEWEHNEFTPLLLKAEERWIDLSILLPVEQAAYYR